MTRNIAAMAFYWPVPVVGRNLLAAEVSFSTNCTLLSISSTR